MPASLVFLPPEERPPLLKDHFFVNHKVVSQEGDYCSKPKRKLETYMYMFQVFKFRFATVVPLLRDHLMVHKKVVFQEGWSFLRGEKDQ